MPLDRDPGPDPAGDRAARIADLNARFRHHGATDVMGAALSELGDVALVSSFGAESVVLLHMAAIIDRSVPVLFIDTRVLFTETLVYQVELTERLGLRNVLIVKTPASDIDARDPYGALRLSDPDACCALRKSQPLQEALSGFGGWITGRKRFQSGQRAALDFFEAEPGSRRIKVNPLAHWAPADVRAYMEENRLPRHPLVARGYPSIGCAPCTARAGEGDPRAGRWPEQDKTECGIHLAGATAARTGERA